MIVLVAAAAGATAPVEPTAWPVSDAALSGALAAFVTYCASRSHRWAWMVLAAVAAFGQSPWLWLGLVALGLAVDSARRSTRSRRVGAVIGALAVQSLLRLPEWEPFGVSAGVAAAAMAPVIVSGWRASPRHVRRRLALIVAGALATSVVLGAVAAATAVANRTAVEEGIDLADSGLTAAENGEDDEAIARLNDAAARFGEVSDAFGAPWMAAARIVPVVGPHVAALEAVTGEGEHLAVLASEAVNEADIDSLRFEDGVIDIARLRDVEPPLARSADGLASADAALADADSPWLVGPVRTRVDDFAEQVADASADADVAVDAVRVAPALFGGDGDRRYLVLFTTPAQARGLGGFIGNYGELSAIDGDVELTRSGRLRSELGPPPGGEPYEISGPADYLARWGRFDPGESIQDITFSPDFPTVGRIWEEVYPQVPGGDTLDGVIMVDPFGLAGLLQLTGPIQVPGRAEPLTADNAADFLLREQYADFQEGRTERVEFLDDATRITFEKLTEGDIPSPRTVIDVLGPLVRGGHLAVHGVADAEKALFERTDIDDAFPEVQGDFGSLTGQNAGNSKIDAYVRRAVDYDVVVDPDQGLIDATVTIELTNDAPPMGLPTVVLENRLPGRPDGTASSLLSWYTPLELESITVDGTEASAERSTELDRNVFSRLIDIPPSGTATVVLRLRGTHLDGDRYRLDLARQPTVNVDELTVSVSGSDGWNVSEADGAEPSDGTAVFEGPFAEDHTIEARFRSD